MLLPGDEVIRSQRRSFAAQIDSRGKLTVRVPLWATAAEIDAFLASKSGWITKHRAAPPPKDPREGLDAAAVAALRCRAEREMPDIAAKWAAVVGDRPDRIRITSARGRFGSCSGRANLCFSLYLLLWPREAVEYVAVHELCHIRHKNHGPAFWAAVEKAMPDWKMRAEMLKKNPLH
ncbi:MAG: DUF45 domain-containing protein [Clostridia bacterium]|nr:DUF45 domain-containing protein [Clostridia bacterium]